MLEGGFIVFIISLFIGIGAVLSTGDVIYRKIFYANINLIVYILLVTEGMKNNSILDAITNLKVIKYLFLLKFV